MSRKELQEEIKKNVTLATWKEITPSLAKNRISKAIDEFIRTDLHELEQKLEGGVKE
jgi:hypothetical protein